MDLSKRNHNHSAGKMLPNTPLPSIVTIFVLLLLVFSPVSAYQHQGMLEPGLARRISTAFYTSSYASLENSARSAVRPQAMLSKTRLTYRNAHEELSGDTTEQSVQAEARKRRGWLKPFASSPPSVSTDDSRQAVVDEYLEFLDRRYHRLHDEEASQPREKFSAWKWLTQGSDDSEQIPEQTEAEREAALYVLGVAGLASEKLLQKHQLPTNRSSGNQKTVAAHRTSGIDYAEVVDAVTTDTVTNTPIVSVVSRLAHRLSVQRKSLLRYQAKKLQALAKILVKTIKAGPGKNLKKLLELGGGKKSVAVTLSVVTALLFLVVRPLAQAIVSEGVAHR